MVYEEPFMNYKFCIKLEENSGLKYEKKNWNPNYKLNYKYKYKRIIYYCLSDSGYINI